MGEVFFVLLKQSDVYMVVREIKLVNVFFFKVVGWIGQMHFKTIITVRPRKKKI